MSKTVIYVVGPEAAIKNNQWSAMTNDLSVVEDLLKSGGEYQTYKEVEVRNVKTRRRK